MAQKDFHAFTVRSPQGLLDELRSPVLILDAFDQSNSFKTQALWDTGATHTSVTKKVAEALKLTPVNTTTIIGIENTPSIVPLYAVDFYFHNDVKIEGHLVSECISLDDEAQLGLLIGMDIITLGDFSITNVDKKTVFSFRVPSLVDVDFVRQHNKRKRLREKKSLRTPTPKRRPGSKRKKK